MSNAKAGRVLFDRAEDEHEWFQKDRRGRAGRRNGAGRVRFVCSRSSRWRSRWTWPRTRRPDWSLRAPGSGVESDRRDIRQQHQATLRQLEERLRAATDSEQAAIQTVPLNEGLIRSSSVALTAARTDLAIEQGRIYNEIWTILTPDQQAQAKKLQSERESQANPRPARRKGLQ
jgi:hypothetical protein